MRQRNFAMLTALALLLAAPTARAAETVTEHQGLDIVGDIALAKGRAIKGDTVAIIVHDTLGHHQDDAVAELQAGLVEGGVSALAITLSLGLNGRRGAFDCGLEHDHRHEDAVDEIGTWVAWAKGQGAAGIVLVGMGRGAAQVALAAQTADKIVRRVAMVQPRSGSADTVARDFAAEHNQPLGTLLAQSLALVDQDESATLIDVPGFLGCARARVTAGAFADYYQPTARQDAAVLIPQSKLPTLVLIADGDPGAEEIAAAAASAPKVVTLDRLPAGSPPDAIAAAAAKRIASFAAARPTAGGPPPAATP